MSSVQVRHREPQAGRRARVSPTWVWIAQVVSGGLLLALLTVHMIANHFVVEGGLRTYAQVAAYVGHPLILAVEVAFLVLVTWHAMLGLYAVLLDLGLGGRGRRIAARALAGLGVATVAYGLWLLVAITSQA